MIIRIYFLASVHLVFGDTNDFHDCSAAVKSFFRQEGIACVTFQPEFVPDDQKSNFIDTDFCYRQCPNETDICSEMQCCTKTTPRYYIRKKSIFSSLDL